MGKVCCFAPIIDMNSRMLILGTLPSKESLKRGEYYGNPRNDFWNITFFIFMSAIPESYEAKRAFLLEHKIALWDVLHCADRESSSDSDIKNEIPNDLEGFLKKYPNIELIILAGTKAEKLFRKYFAHIHIKHVRVPSSSPMRGKNVKSLAEKKAEWRRALTFR